MTNKLTTAIAYAAYGHWYDLAAIILPFILKNPNNLNRIKAIAYHKFNLSSEIVDDSINTMMELKGHEKTSFNNIVTH